MNQLIHFDKAKKELALATSIDEIKPIVDKANALATYFKQSGECVEMQNQVMEIKIRGERRGGEIFKEIEREQGKRSDLTSDTEEPKLKQIENESGVTSTTRKKWEATADIPEEDFENHIAETKDKNKELTSLGVQKLAKEEKKKKKQEELKQALNKVEIPPNLEPIYGDFRESQIENNNIDLIITDPPYPKEYLPLWKDLSLFANRVLKPSSFLIAYSGELHLPEVIQSLSANLIYYWTFALILSGDNQLINARNIICGWKPILVFQKPPLNKIESSIRDIFPGSGKEKDLHDWQQSEKELDILINGFSKPGNTILDPFAGSGTTMIASIKNKRIPIGIDNEKQNIEKIRGRIAKALQKQ